MKRLLFPVLLSVVGASVSKAGGADFCLKQCTEDFCRQSQDNYQQCQDACRGKYEGLIARCKIAAREEKFKDNQVKEDAKYRPCLSANLHHSSINEEEDDEGKGHEKHQNDDASPDESEDVVDAESQETSPTNDDDADEAL